MLGKKTKQPIQTEEELEQFEEDEEELEEEAEEEEEEEIEEVKPIKAKPLPPKKDWDKLTPAEKERLMYPPKFWKLQDKEKEVEEEVKPTQPAQPETQAPTFEDVVSVAQNLLDRVALLESRVTSLEASAYRMRGAI